MRWPTTSVVLSLALSLACATTSPAVRRGDEAAEKGLWRQALEAYDQAAADRPDDPSVLDRRDRARRELAGVLLADARAALDLGSLERADSLWQEARELEPTRPEVRSLAPSLGRAWLEASEKRLSESDPAGAFHAADRARTLLPDDEDARAAREQTLRTYVDRLYSDASSWAHGGSPGAALVALTRVRSLLPDYRDVESRIFDMRLAVKKRVRYAVEVLPLEGSGQARRAAHAIAGELIEIPAPADCPRMEVSRVAVSGPGVSLRLQVRDAGLSTEQDKKTETRTYQAGTRKVKNPAHAEAVEEVALREKALQAAIADLKAAMGEVEARELELVEASPDADLDALRQALDASRSTRSGAKKAARAAAEALGVARKRLESTPKKIDEPVMKSADLTIVDVTRTATLQLAATLVDLTTGLTLEDGWAVEARAETRDTRHPAIRAAGIEADPLDLEKTDDELRREVLDAIRTQLLDRLVTACRAHGDRTTATAVELSGAEDLRAATDAWMESLFLEMGPPPAEADRFFASRWGLAGTRAVLGATD